MMELVADTRIAFPRELVFSTYRDRLPELVPHLPNVKSISVEKREDGVGGDPARTRLVNVWRAKGEIPRVARAILDAEKLAWDDHAIWNASDWSTEWRIETRMFTNHVKCAGRNTYHADGDAVLLRIRGNLDVDLRGLPGVPRLLASTVAPAVEKFIIALLTPNLTSVARGLESFLRAEEAKGRSR